MLTQVKGGRRAIWYPSKSKNRQNRFVLFIPGFPKYPSKSEFVNFFVELGFDVLVPMYSGTFESSGKFSIKNSVNDVLYWYNFCQRGTFYISPIKKKRVRIKEIIIFSSSFGCLVAGLALKKFPLKKIRKSIFVSPLWNMPAHKNDGVFKKMANETLKMINFSYPRSYRFVNKSDFFSQISGVHNVYQKSKDFLDHSKLFYVFCGKEDKTTPVAMSKALIKEYENSKLYILDGGHSSRIDLNRFKKITKHICLSQLK